MSEQGEVTQIDNSAAAEKVHPEVATASDKVVESTEKPAEDSIVSEEKATEQSTNDVADKKEAADGQVESAADKEAEPVEKALEADNEPQVEQPEDKVAADTTETSGVAEAEKVVESNGDAVDHTAEAVNGVQKRKAENGSEPVADEEKSPKKAKVVDEGDQTKVEETAA